MSPKGIQWDGFKFKSFKTQLVVFLALFSGYVAVSESNLIALPVILVITVWALIVEASFLYPKRKAVVITESATITGLILGLVMATDQPWWLLGLATVVAISSKYLIRYNNKPVFNPASFGILALMILFHLRTEWKGTYLWYILAPAGTYFIYKIRKFELLASYFFVALLLFGIKAWQQHIALTTVFGFFSYFFIFIMLIEPITTPISNLGKIVFGAGVAALIFILTESGKINFDAELAALLVFNALVPFLNKLSLPWRKA